MEIVRNSFLFLFSDVLLEKCEGFLELYKFPGKKKRKKKMRMYPVQLEFSSGLWWVQPGPIFTGKGMGDVDMGGLMSVIADVRPKCQELVWKKKSKKLAPVRCTSRWTMFSFFVSLVSVPRVFFQMETFNDGCGRPVRTLNSFQMTGASENNTSSRRRAKKPSLRFVCFCFLCEEFRSLFEYEENVRVAQWPPPFPPTNSISICDG